MMVSLEDGLEERRGWWRSGTAGVAWMAVGTVVVHLATGWRYGFDRDELMLVEDARHLAWGYVQYPPMTAFFGRLALMMFGTSLAGFRFIAAVVQAVALVLAGSMAKELGGGKWAQVVAALAGVPFCLGGGALMQYISFDYVCWVVVAYCLVRLLGGGTESLETKVEEWNSERVEESRGDARWWLGVGAGIGLGMMAKYTMGFLAAGVVAGVLLTGARRYLRSGWLWAGALLAIGICLPNFLWEWQRHFESLEFLKFLHERDVRTGVTDWFLAGQVELTLLAFPLALAGLWFYLFAEEGKRWRALGWMYALPLVLFLVMRGRDYYLAPGYPMLYAAGAVWVERKTGSKEVMKRRSKEAEKDNAETQGFAKKIGRTPSLEGTWGRVVRQAVCAALILDVVIAAGVALPIAPVNSGWWQFARRVDSVFAEEIGWPEFVETVARVRDRLPVEERGRLGILAGNYGEVGALNLYGERYGLPRAISGVNSSWERGYGNPAPETAIVAGYSREFLERHFASCEVGGRTWNRFGVMNEETIEDPDIFVCRGLKESWEEFWRRIRKFA